MRSKTHPRVLFLQHAVYPYRRPVFDVLARELDLTVAFCLRSKTFRRWDTSVMFDRPSFRARLLPGIHIGPLVINPTIPWEFLRARFDVVVIGGVDLLSVVQALALVALAKLTRTPIVVCEEYFPNVYATSQHPMRTRLARQIRGFIYGHSSGFATWNRKARLQLEELGISPSRIFSGPHFYPPPDPFPTRVPRTLEAPPVVAAIGYLLPHKGLDVLVQAFRRLDTDARLVIGGDGPELKLLQGLAAGDDRIELAGYLDEPAKGRLLARASVFVLPSLRDAWGLVVNEAMAYGLPVIVSDAAGCSDELVDDNGFVVPAGDEEALALRLRTLLDDVALRESMGARSTEIIRRCTAEAMAAPVLSAVKLATRLRETRCGLFTRYFSESQRFSTPPNDFKENG